MGLFGWPSPSPVLYLLSGHSSALMLCPSSPNLAHFLSPPPITFVPVTPFAWHTVHPTPLTTPSPPHVCPEDTTCLSILNASFLSYTLEASSSMLKQAILPSTVFTDHLVHKSTLPLLFIIICLHGSGSSSAPSSLQPT